VLRGCEFVTAGNQDNRQRRSAIPDDLLKREPVRAQHANVGYYAVNFGDCRIKELLCRSEQSAPVPGRLQQIFKQIKDSVVIVNHRHYRFLGAGLP
jgi:hypothetical protein